VATAILLAFFFFSQDFPMLRTVAVGNVLELGNRRWDLQAHVEDLLLALKTDVCGPSDHAADIALGLDVLADTEVLGALLDERVLASLEFCNRVKTCWRDTHLGGLLATTSLALGEGGRRRFLSFRRHLCLLSRLS
jgi:hypothetical protein